ncbi:MAG: DUF975 family protein [Clostridia bacterium]|nr:DUF975 family protein [Clostridia bacterium]
MVDNATIRANARAQLGGNIFSNYWLMMLVCGLIANLIIAVASSIPFLSLIVMGPIYYGFARVAKNRACGYPTVEFSDLFTGFTENLAGSIILGLMRYIFTFLWALLLIVPGVIKSYSYAMCHFIQQDDPSKDWKTCINESMQMMEGHKWDLFCIDVVMILWSLLGVLACGIGVFFVIPYQQMSHANFYLALKASREPAHADPMA